MIDLAILGLLSQQDLHGYELRKQLSELFGPRQAVSFGSVYPALAKLERTGAVKAVTQAAAVPAAPMSGSLAGELAAFRANGGSLDSTRRGSRGKKVYGITDEGRERLRDLLTSTEATDRDFPVQVAFCHLLSPDERLSLFERRRDELLASRARRPVATNRYMRSLVEHDLEVISADLAWLDRLIESERSTGSGPGTPHEHGGQPQP